MAILHGSWLPGSICTSASAAEDAAEGNVRGAAGCFFLWGEVWRRVDPLPATDASLSHPFTLTWAELRDRLFALQQAGQITWPVAEVTLAAPQPAKRGRGRRKANAVEEPPEPLPEGRWRSLAFSSPADPVDVEDETYWMPRHSAQSLATEELPTLQTWQVCGISLTPMEAIQFLNSLPLGWMDASDGFLGADLRFWSHVARWNLDLLARSRFIPGLHAENDDGDGFWQVLLDSSVDQERLQQFVKRMPGACCTYQATEEKEVSPTFASPRVLLLDFLNGTIEAQVRAAIANYDLPNLPLSKDAVTHKWLLSLGMVELFTANSNHLERLNTLLAQWRTPLQRHLDQQIASFRTCFQLHPPAAEEKIWSLEYGLQSTDNPDLVIPATTIWENPVEQMVVQGQMVEQPQETLLAGLGLASRLYPLIEPSLETERPESCPLEPLQAYEFIKSVGDRLRDSGIGVILPPSLARQEGWANRLGLSVRAEPPKKSKGMGLKSLLNFRWELTIGGQQISKKEFDRLVALNTPLVEINGEWVELRPQDIKAAQTFFSSRKDQNSLSLEDALRMSTGDTQVIDKLPVLNFEAAGALEELINTLTKGNQSLENIPTPDGFRGELRPYQERGVSWLSFLQRWGLGACLADDMGLGKTIQFIAFLLHLKEADALEHPTLLVCPTSVLGNWEREVRRFAPALKVMVHHGDRRDQGKEFLRKVKGKDLIITSYALLYRDEADLKKATWQGLVLDEAQNIKNPEARQSQVVRQLEADFRITLTGTPVENRLSELWSIMDFLNPGYLGPRNFFQRRFAVPIERYGDTDSLKTLRSLVQPFILRRLKTDRSIIQDLPDKQEMTIFCGLTADQAAIYQSLVDQSLREIESSEGIQRHGMILALLTKLKQVCNHPLLLKDESEEGKSKNGSHPPSLEQSGKLKRLEEMLEELLSEGDRALIFTQFATWGTWLQTYLEDRFNRDVLFLYGSTSKKQREAMVDRFQNDPQGPRIFILSLKAGGVGLNLTRANHVFHFDRWWNPAVENQATDRAFRIGQTRNVQVHKFVCTGTLEDRIHELIESKKALAEQIVGTGESWLTDLNTDQLRDLLILDRSAIIDEN
ncbi:MAG: DEAD/DEAH box helicase [Cyanobacteria bacterium J06638_20]